MKKNIRLEKEQVILQSMTQNENACYCESRNMEENRRWFTFSGIITSDEQKKWYQQYLLSETDYMFSIYNSEQIFLGGNAIYNIDYSDNSGEYGRLLIALQEESGKGNGYWATCAALEIAKKHLALKSLYLEVYKDNLAAIKTYIKAGFIITEETCDKTGREMYMMKIILN